MNDNRSSTTRNLLEVRDLKVHFPIRSGWFGRASGSVRAVDGVSLSVRKGQVLGLVGESGCGKTTLGRAIVRLVPINAGSILFDGADLAALPEARLRPLRRRLQMVFQDPYHSLNPRKTVRRILSEGLQIHRLENDPDRRRAFLERLLGRVGLDPAALDRRPAAFSGGQRQRIGIARALSVGPELIVCDEPVSSLDTSVQAQILNLLSDLRDVEGLAYLFISHDLSVVRHLADRIAVMYLGQIVEEGPTEEVFGRPLHPYTQALLAAVPTIGALGRKWILLGGEPPSPSAPPPGCRFHPRCPLAVDRCRTEIPSETGPGQRRVRCFLADPGASPPGPAPANPDNARL